MLLVALAGTAVPGAWEVWYAPETKMRWLLLLSTTFTLAACRNVDPNYGCVTRPGSETRLVADSPEVRRLLSEAANREEKTKRLRLQLPEDRFTRMRLDMEIHPERYMSDRNALFAAMARRPSVTVIGQQYFRCLETSPAGCANDPSTTSNYLRARVTTGSSKGAEGWACSRDVQPIGGFVM